MQCTTTPLFQELVVCVYAVLWYDLCERVCMVWSNRQADRNAVVCDL